MLIESFPAVIEPDARVLILGSMPGERSLAAGEYYAHPRNRYWPLMQELIGLDPKAPYSERIKQLTRAGVALWDVLKHCRRDGSLDDSIVRNSEVTNDIAQLLEDHPSVKAVGLNGQKAAKVFRRWVVPDLRVALRERLVSIELPSTSPANATRSLADLLDAWRALMPYLSEARSSGTV